MRNLILFAILGVFLLGFISCEKDDPEFISQQDGLEEITKRKQATVPFRATYRVHTIDYEGTQCEEMEIYLLADGKALHLGKSTWESCTFIDFTTPYPYLQYGSMTFTAANGSQLFGTFTGTFDGQAGIGDFEITHGNGKFAGTTGEGVYEWIDMAPRPNPLTFIGTLTKP
jgi:hypothetical protein